MEQLKAILCGHCLRPDGSFGRNGIVLFSGGKIIAAGTGFEVPDHAEVIDASAYYVTPGLIECHGHLAMDEVNETSDPVTPDVRIYDIMAPENRDIEFLRNAGFTVHCTLPGSANVIGGTGLAVKLKPGRTVEDIAIPEVQPLKMALGDNPKMSYGLKGRTPVTRMANMALARKTFAEARKYLEKREKNELEAPDLRLEPVADAIAGKRRVRIHAHKPVDIAQAVRFSEEFGLDYTVEHCTGGRYIAEFLLEHHVRCNVGPLLINPLKNEMEDQDPANPGCLEKAGITDMALIMDDSWSTAFLPAAAGTCVSQGLSMEAGMRGITIEAAKTLKLENRMGSLAAGMDADIAVFTGHPLKNTSRCVTTVIDGVLYGGLLDKGGVRRV